jgi:hypothetical protein
MITDTGPNGKAIDVEARAWGNLRSAKGRPPQKSAHPSTTITSMTKSTVMAGRVSSCRRTRQ